MYFGSRGELGAREAEGLAVEGAGGRQLVREVAHDIQESGNRSNSVISSTIADDMPKVIGDRTQLAQLLHNIRNILLG